MVRKYSCIALAAAFTFLSCCAVSQAEPQGKVDEDTVTLFLKNGGAVTGTFLRSAVSQLRIRQPCLTKAR